MMTQSLYLPITAKERTSDFLSFSLEPSEIPTLSRELRSDGVDDGLAERVGKKLSAARFLELLLQVLHPCVAPLQDSVVRRYQLQRECLSHLLDQLFALVQLRSVLVRQFRVDETGLGLDIGSLVVLERYQRWRRFDTFEMGW
jgi:hypothetical protein